MASLGRISFSLWHSVKKKTTTKIGMFFKKKMKKMGFTNWKTININNCHLIYLHTRKSLVFLNLYPSNSVQTCSLDIFSHTKTRKPLNLLKNCSSIMKSVVYMMFMQNGIIVQWSITSIFCQTSKLPNRLCIHKCTEMLADTVSLASTRFVLVKNIGIKFKLSTLIQYSSNEMYYTRIHK